MTRREWKRTILKTLATKMMEDDEACDLFGLFEQAGVKVQGNVIDDHDRIADAIDELVNEFERRCGERIGRWSR